MTASFLSPVCLQLQRVETRSIAHANLVSYNG